jgi:DMSO/TMAO reductase YedYZ molybdopterin-dependent catalytic subunit
MNSGISRREAMVAGGMTLASMMAHLSSPGFVFPAQGADEELVPFLNMPRTGPNMLDWETLDSWLTPQDQVFSVSHYNVPKVDAAEFRLEIAGLVEHPKTFTIDEIRSMPKQDQLMTLECSGNGSSKGFIGAVYNSRWSGTPLGPILKQCGIKAAAKEIVFFGEDKNEETLRKGTPRETTTVVPFGRSIDVADAMGMNLLLAYERNGKPLEGRNGAPLRLIVPGWYGIANVKWLRRIELRSGRYMGRFMGRDYVTLRGERQGSEVVYVESSVSQMNLKSIVARVTRQATDNGTIPTKAYGAVWSNGTEIQQVQVRVDDGEWMPAKLDAEPKEKYCWRFFSIDLGRLKPGKHVVISRATDVNGREQPSAEDDEIKLKKTYWEAYAQWPREIELQA